MDATCWMRLRVRKRLIVLGATLILGLFFAPGIAPAAATGSTFHHTAGIANGNSGIQIAYRGNTASPADKLGDLIVFTVEPASGSSAVPVFANGLTTTTIPLGGAPCDSNVDAGTTPGATSKCFARATVFSSKPGDVLYTATNSTTPDDDYYYARVTFYPPRAVVAALRRGSDPSELAVQNTATVTSRIVVDFYSSSGVNHPMRGWSFRRFPVEAVLEDRSRPACRRSSMAQR